MRFEKYECYKDSEVEWLGEIPCEWEIKRNKDISKIVDCKNRTPEIFDNQKYFVVRTTNVKNGKLNFNKATYTNKKNFIEWTKRGTPKENSILFTREAPLGEVCLVPKDIDLCLGQRMMNFTIKKNSYKYILYYLLSDNFQNYLKVIASGSTVKHLRVFQVYDFHIAIPPLKTQQKIATYLDTQTQKIEKEINLLEQKIEKYKELKQTLINETVLRGLDKGVELKDSGVEWIGEIPKSWRITKFKNLNDTFFSGTTPDSKNDEYYNGNISWITIADIKGKFVKKGKRNLSQKFLDKYPQKFTKKGNLLFTFKLSIGKVAFAKNDFITNEAIITVQKNNKCNLEYLYYSMPIFITKNAIQNIYGADLLNRDLIKNAKILDIPLNEQIQIANYLDEKTQKIDNITQTITDKIELLKEFRKTLVNDVVTGRVKV